MLLSTWKQLHFPHNLGLSVKLIFNKCTRDGESIKSVEKANKIDWWPNFHKQMFIFEIFLNSNVKRNEIKVASYELKKHLFISWWRVFEI